jgi:hypothetical protein
MKIQHFHGTRCFEPPDHPGARAAVLAGPLTNAANGQAYYLLSDTSWTASEAEARGLGGHLATIKDAADVGPRYAVERSATWSNWTTIRSDTANVNPMTVNDTAATNRVNFYQVRRWPNP